MSEHQEQEMEGGLSRRQFVSAGAAVAVGAVLAPGVFLHSVAQARSPAEGASNYQRWGLLIDTNKCRTGCDDCVSACKKENGWGNEQVRDEQKVQWIRKVDLKEHHTGREVSLPMMCQHCAEPPCVDVCPTGASFKRADGIVLVDKHICIGCRYCMMACPYKARSFVHEDVIHGDAYMPRGKGTVESCTLCVHRVDKGQNPACVESCKEKAMTFGDLNDPKSEIAQRVSQYATRQIRADLKLNPGVRYEGI
ncbi:MAG: 4Fe-4S dicluster domain-containing protein [Gammaproteobacteria bacterium]|nr:4Fe-4S dicluster domain-containing protein [Gammaproteobacteria bacterium]